MALLWGGTPERLIEAAGDGALELFTSEALLAELAETVGAAPLDEAALRDPDDAAVLGPSAHRTKRGPAVRGKPRSHIEA